MMMTSGGQGQPAIPDQLAVVKAGQRWLGAASGGQDRPGAAGGGQGQPFMT